MKSNVEWEEWGERDPLFGVASWTGREKGGPHAWSEDDFYAVGALDWGDYEAHWSNYGLSNRCCVEIGCGAGRLTEHLIESFDEVIGVDVSPGMIAQAEKRLGARARLLLTDGLELPIASSSASAAISTFVFQHFESVVDADAYWKELARVLEPDGTLMIQLPIHAWPHNRRLYDLTYAVQRAAGDFRARVRRRLLARGLSKPFMRGLSYEQGRLLRTVGEMGFADLELRSFHVRSNGELHTFLFARRVPVD